MSHNEIFEDEDTRCKLCGKTLAELEAEGYKFYERVMVCVGGDYHNAVCPACLDVLDERIVGIASENNGFMREVLKDMFPQLLFEYAITLQAGRSGCSRDKALELLLENIER